MFAGVVFILAISVVAFADDASVGTALVLPEEKMQMFRDAWERHDLSEMVTDLNGIVDDIFEQIDYYMIQAGLDPIELDEIHKGFKFKILLITYHGELDLTDGWMQDLSTLHRVGDVSMTLQGSGKVVSISVPLGFDDLMFTYLYSAKLMNIGPTGGLDGKVTNIQCSLVLDVDLETNLLSLNTFKITKSGSISLKFSGNSLTDWMVNLFTSVITTVLHDLILLIASNAVKGNLESVIERINELISAGNSTIV